MNVEDYRRFLELPHAKFKYMALIKFWYKKSSELHIVVKKAKGRISKRVLQENKARLTNVCVSGGVRNVRFFGKFGASLQTICWFVLGYKYVTV